MTDPNRLTGQADKVNGTATVVIGCKLPNGLILEMGKVNDENYQRVILNGSNARRVLGPDAVVIAGYGLTTIAKDFWDAWRKKNSKLKFVRDGHVFEHTTEASARDHAKDMAGLRTGLEPVDPLKPVLGRAPDGSEIKVEVDQEHFQRARNNIQNLGL